MQWFFQWILRLSGQASVLIILVLLAQWLFRQRLSPRWRYCLWLLVLARLALPATWESGLSLFNGHCYALASLERITAERNQPRDLIRDQRLAHDSLPSRRTPNIPEPQAAVEGRGVGAEINLPRGSAPADQPADSLRSSTSKQQPASSVLRPLLPLFWLTGVLIFGLRILGQNVRFWRCLRQQPLVTNASVLQLLAECQQVMSMRSPLVLMETAAVKSPALYGLFRRCLLLPAGMLERFSLAELRYVFLHELAHLKRQDLPVNWLMTILQVLHWFNPLVWLAFRRMAADRELACDELVLSSESKVEAQGYGETIIKLLEGFVRPASVPGLLGLLEDKNQMERRIRMIAKFKKSNRWPVFALGLLLALGLLTLTDAQNKVTSEKPSAAASVQASQPTNKVVTTVAEKAKPVATAEISDVIDPKTSLKFTVAKTITGENDIIEHYNKLSLSPNGKYLLWWGRIIPLDGRRPFSIKELSHVGEAAWSPDGTMIAYVDHGLCLLPISPDTAQPSGPMKRLLTSGDQPDSSTGRILWSLNSEKILWLHFEDMFSRQPLCFSVKDGKESKTIDYIEFGIRTPDGNELIYSVPGQHNGLWIKPVTGGPSRNVSGGWGHYYDKQFWSQDGRWLVFSASAGYSPISSFRFLNLANRQEFILSPPEQVGHRLGTSPDQKNLLFYRASYDYRVVPKIASTRGGALRELRSPFRLEIIDEHYWLPDSGTIVISGGDDINFGYWAMPIAGGAALPLKLEGALPNELVPESFSPDGQMILLRTPYKKTNRAREHDLHVASFSLKEGRALSPAKLLFKGWTPGHVTAEMAVWSPDSKRIALRHRDEETWNESLWVVSTQSGAPLKLMDSPGKKTGLVWSPNCKMLAWRLDTPENRILQVIGADGGAAKLLSPNLVGSGCLNWFWQVVF